VSIAQAFGGFVGLTNYMMIDINTQPFMMDVI